MCETEPLEDQVIQAVKYTKEKLRRGVKEERVQECLKHLNRRAEISIVIKDLIEKKLLILVSINMQINVVLKYFDSTVCTGGGSNLIPDYFSFIR